METIRGEWEVSGTALGAVSVKVSVSACAETSDLSETEMVTDLGNPKKEPWNHALSRRWQIELSGQPSSHRGLAGRQNSRPSETKFT